MIYCLHRKNEPTYKKKTPLSLSAQSKENGVFLRHNGQITDKLPASVLLHLSDKKEKTPQIA